MNGRHKMAWSGTDLVYAVCMHRLDLSGRVRSPPPTAVGLLGLPCQCELPVQALLVSPPAAAARIALLLRALDACRDTSSVTASLIAMTRSSVARSANLCSSTRGADSGVALPPGIGRAIMPAACSASHCSNVAGVLVEFRTSLPFAGGSPPKPGERQYARRSLRQRVASTTNYVGVGEVAAFPSQAQRQPDFGAQPAGRTVAQSQAAALALHHLAGNGKA